jgi:hypothetical protein
MGRPRAILVDVGAEWINSYSGCWAGDLDYCSVRAQGFYNMMTSHWHVGRFIRGNSDAQGSDFVHPSFNGNSLQWVDNVHFCFFSGHGTNSTEFANAFAITFGNCLSVFASTFRMGSGKLKWIVFDCCDAVMNTEPDHVTRAWADLMQGVHLVLGFIGPSHDWSGTDGSDFGDWAGTGQRLANAWLDAAYSWIPGDYPIAIAAGVDGSDAVNRCENETTDWRDLGVARTDWLAWKWRD